MKRKMVTYEFVKEHIKTLGYELISNTYIKSSEKIILKDIYGYFYVSIWNKIQQKEMPDRFNKFNPYTIQNIKLWCKLNDKPFELIGDEYKNNHENLIWQCLKEGCKEQFEMNWNNTMTSKKCPYCAGQKVGLSNCLAIKNPELTIEWHPTKNGNLTPYNITCNSGKYMWWKCKKCNHEWKSSVCNRNKNKGCPRCKETAGERKISTYLNNYDIKYISQKTFSGLIGLGGGLLSYDFYLSDYNLLIEYQGEFHDGNNGKGNYYIRQNLEKQQEHDRRKREYAKSLNINFMEIWYYDYNNIEDILQKIT